MKEHISTSCYLPKYDIHFHFWYWEYCLTQFPWVEVSGRDKTVAKKHFPQVNSRDNWGSSDQEHLDPRGKGCLYMHILLFKDSLLQPQDSSSWQAESQAKLGKAGDPNKSETTKKRKHTEGGSRNRYPRKHVETVPEHAKMRLGKSKPTWNGTWRGKSRHQEELPQTHNQKKEDWGNVSPLFNFNLTQDTLKKCWVPSSL